MLDLGFAAQIRKNKCMFPDQQKYINTLIYCSTILFCYTHVLQHARCHVKCRALPPAAVFCRFLFGLVERSRAIIMRGQLNSNTVFTRTSEKNCRHTARASPHFCARHTETQKHLHLNKHTTVYLQHSTPELRYEW